MRPLYIACQSDKPLKTSYGERCDFNGFDIEANLRADENLGGRAEEERGWQRDRYAACRYPETDVKDAEQIKKFAVKLMFPDDAQEQACGKKTPQSL